MAKKLTKDEWSEQFNSKFEKEIKDFLHSDKTLFGNNNLTAELKYCIGNVLHDKYFVKMELNQMEQYENRTEFLLTDYNGVQFFAAEYYKGSISIGVAHGRKIVCGHVLNIAEYTKDGDSTRKLMRIIRDYIALFISMMNVQHHIGKITELAGKRNI